MYETRLSLFLRGLSDVLLKLQALLVSFLLYPFPSEPNATGFPRAFLVQQIMLKTSMRDLTGVSSSCFFTVFPVPENPPSLSPVVRMAAGRAHILSFFFPLPFFF